jgi:hypothetical protein
MNQGATANKTGKLMETQISMTLIGQGYFDRSGTSFVLDDSPFFRKQAVIEKNIFGQDYRCDFYVFHPCKYPIGLQIEVKYQGVSGSVDEKYVYTVETLKNLHTPSILILDGGGARQCVIDWIEKQQTEKFVFIPGISAFNNWARRNL